MKNSKCWTDIAWHSQTHASLCKRTALHTGLVSKPFTIWFAGLKPS